MDTPKSIPINIASQVVICGVFGTWHGLFTVTTIQSIQKSTRNSQKIGHKLASRRQNVQGLQQREIELINKKEKGKRR